MLGLAVGIAATVTLGLFVRYETSYDRFHEHADRLYVLAEHAVRATDEQTYVYTRSPAFPTLMAEQPEVAGGSRVQQWREWVGHEGRRSEISVAWVDSTFLDAFTFPTVAGDPRAALTRPDAIALTASTARRIFSDADPVGQVLQRGFDEGTFEVVGVVADPPAASTFQFDALAAWLNVEDIFSPGNAGGWYNSNTRTFVLLREGVNPAAFEQQLAAFQDRHYERYDGTEVTLRSMPLTELRAFQAENGPLLALLAAIAVATLLIASINFVNLATARSLERAKEVGMRKALGAHRGQLASQFLGEALVVAGLALVLGVVLAGVLIPYVNARFDLNLALDLGAHAPALLALGLVVGLGAGLYPALALASFQPIRALKGTARRGRGGVRLRQGLLVVQFALAVFLAGGAVVVWQQVSYLRGQDAGFQEEHVVVVPLHGRALGTAEAADARLESFRQALLADAPFAAASLTDIVPGRYQFNFNTFYPGSGPAAEGGVRLRQSTVDRHYFETLGAPLLAGVPFAAFGAELADSLVVINRTAALALGASDPAEALGTVLRGGGGGRRLVVAGVVEDFTYGSLQQAVEPLVHFHSGTPSRLAVRVRPGSTVAALDALRAQWETLFPGLPFDYAFLDAELDGLYKAQERLGLVVGFFSGLALFVACLGLFGLATYAAQERTKEVGVRKVLGASVGSVVRLLSRDFLKPVALAALIATPLAYLAAERWLEGFAHRIELGLGGLLGGGLGALAVALLTVSYHAVRAATSDPVKALRTE